MNWRETIAPHLTEVWSQIVAFAPSLVSAVAILVAGWFVALIAGASTRWALGKTKIDNRLASWIIGKERADQLEVERWTGKLVYYLVMLFVAVAFFEALGLTLVTQPLQELLGRIVGFLPGLLGAVLLAVAAWLAATATREIVSRTLSLTNLDDRLAEQTGVQMDKARPMSHTLSESLYWLVMILFLPAILGVLGLEGLLAPVQAMASEFFAFLPNVFGAVVILLAGWLVARIVQRLVTNILASTGLDGLGARAGLVAKDERRKLSDLVGLVVYVLILLPVVIASLGALGLEAVTRPASEMLSTVMAALPQLFGGAVVLGLAYFVGKLLSELVASLLAAAGFDNILSRLGLTKSAAPASLSNLVGHIVLVLVIVVASSEAARIVGFATLSELLMGVLVFAGQVALGIIVFGLGLYVAGLAERAVSASASRHASLLATAARIAIVGLSLAMGLRAMGFANEIVNLAFGLIVGSVAVAVALAFGLGARDVAAEAVRGWFGRSQGSA